MTAALVQLGTSTGFAASKSLCDNNFELSPQHTPMSVPVSIEGILERKASAVPFLFATHAACVQNEKASSVTYTFELIRYCSFGRVASFICVKMDRSAATKVPNPVSLPFPVVVCN